MEYYYIFITRSRQQIDKQHSMDTSSTSSAPQYSGGHVRKSVGLNIDDFHNEILMAENYLQNADDRFSNRRNEPTESENNMQSVEYEENEQNRHAPYLDDERRSDILRKFGREPLQTRQRSLSREREDHSKQVTERGSGEVSTSERVHAWEIPQSSHRQRTSTSSAIGVEGSVNEEIIALNRLKLDTRYQSNSHMEDDDSVDEDSLGGTDEVDAIAAEDSSGILFFASDLRNSNSSQLSTPRSQTMYDVSPSQSPRFTTTESATVQAASRSIGKGNPKSSTNSGSTAVRSSLSSSRTGGKASSSSSSSSNGGHQQSFGRPSSAPRQPRPNTNTGTAIVGGSNSSSNDAASSRASASRSASTNSRYDRLLKQPAHKLVDPKAPVTTVNQNVPTRTREDILERVEQMRRDHERKLALREKQKIDFEQMDLMKCTFKPTISKGMIDLYYELMIAVA